MDNGWDGCICDARSAHARAWKVVARMEGWRYEDSQSVMQVLPSLNSIAAAACMQARKSSLTLINQK